MDLDRFIAAGLYSPEAAGAAERRELLEHLLERGFTAARIIEAAQRLTLVTDIAYALANNPPQRITLHELADRSQMPAEEVAQFRRALALPVDRFDTPDIPEEFVSDVALYRAAAEQFGRDRTLSFARVVGTAIATITEAGRELFAAPLRDSRARELEISQANELAMGAWHALRDLIGRLMLERTARDLWFEAGIINGELPMAVGFVDLVDSTGWTAAHDEDEVAAALARFEAMAAELAVASGARVVKFVGDEVMLAAVDPEAAAAASLALCEATAADPSLPSARGAVAFGDVVPRRGDYYGTIVNLAARATKIADPDEILVTAAVAERLDPQRWAVGALEPQYLRGLPDAVRLFRLDRPATAVPSPVAAADRHEEPPNPAPGADAGTTH